MALKYVYDKYVSAGIIHSSRHQLECFIAAANVETASMPPIMPGRHGEGFFPIAIPSKKIPC